MNDQLIQSPSVLTDKDLESLNFCAVPNRCPRRWQLREAKTNLLLEHVENNVYKVLDGQLSADNTCFMGEIKNLDTLRSLIGAYGNNCARNQ